MGSGKGIQRRVRSTTRGKAPAPDNSLTDLNLKDGAEAYTHFVRNTPVLTRAEERILGARANKGDLGAQQKLVEHNQLWVLKEARKFIGLGMDFDDLVQEGNLGLMRAARDYAPERGSFITYARNWVTQFMRRAVEQKGSTSKYGSQVPSYLYSVVGKVKKEKQRLAEDGKKFDIEEVAEKLDESPARVQAAVDVLERSFVPIDKPVGSDGEGSTTLGEIIPDGGSIEDEVENRIEGDELKELISSGLDLLSDEERTFMEKRYGLNGAEGSKQKDVCEDMGISRSHASYLQEQSLKKLRKHMEHAASV